MINASKVVHWGIQRFYRHGFYWTSKDLSYIAGLHHLWLASDYSASGTVVSTRTSATTVGVYRTCSEEKSEEFLVPLHETALIRSIDQHAGFELAS